MFSAKKSSRQVVAIFTHEKKGETHFFNNANETGDRVLTMQA